MTSRRAGFTLLEMVLALAIFALLGLMANRVLHQAFTLEQFSARHAQRLAQIQYAMATLERDFSAMLPRSVRTPGEFGGASPSVEPDGSGIVFTHGGWLNPGAQLARGTLQRVAWRLENGVLIRRWTDYPDMPNGHTVYRRNILNDVTSLRLRVWSQGEWASRWPDDRALPQAIEISLTLAEGGTVTRRFMLAEGE